MSFPLGQKSCSSCQGPPKLEGCVYMQEQHQVGTGTWRLHLPRCCSWGWTGTWLQGNGGNSYCTSQAAPSREKNSAWSLCWWQMCAQSLLNHSLSPFCDGLAPGLVLIPIFLGPLDGHACSAHPHWVQRLVVGDHPWTSREPLMAWALSGACTDSGTARNTTLRFKLAFKAKQLQHVESAPGSGKKWQKRKVCQKRMLN